MTVAGAGFAGAAPGEERNSLMPKISAATANQTCQSGMSAAFNSARMAAGESSRRLSYTGLAARASAKEVAGAFQPTRAGP